MSSYREADLLPLSALQHLLFCERQCALIHLEQIWVENRLTAEGRAMHERVDRGGRESRREDRVAYALRLRSMKLGLIGKADVVEFHREGNNWIPFPVEYKRGKPKIDDIDRVQLCAQAMCLEEMLSQPVPEGALFYGTNCRRENVAFDEGIRRTTEQAAVRLHQLIKSGRTPPAVYAPKCDSCSLVQQCLPQSAGRGKDVAVYLKRMINS
jgi:CRISPR-associated exonuclease Cas4